MSMFKKGYKSVREEKQRQDEARERMNNQLWRFFISADAKKGEAVEADVRFLTEEPINFYEHNVKVVRNGKDFYENVICTSEIGECAMCNSGDTAQFKGAFLVFDKRPFEIQDKKSGKKKTVPGSLKLYVQGTKILSQLDRLSNKYGLTNRDYTIVRIGSGTSTTYTFEKGDEDKLTKKEIEAMLGEKYSEFFDGTLESLYSLVQNQLELMVEGDEDEDEDEEDNKSLIGIEEDDEEDEEEYTKPKKTGLFKSNKKPKENSVKKMLRNKTNKTESRNQVDDDDDVPF